MRGVWNSLEKRTGELGQELIAALSNLVTAAILVVVTWVIDAIVRRLGHAGIEIPLPQRVLTLRAGPSEEPFGRPRGDDDLRHASHPIP